MLQPVLLNSSILALMVRWVEKDGKLLLQQCCYAFRNLCCSHPKNLRLKKKQENATLK